MTYTSTRSTHRSPQTLKQARAEFKKCGPRLSSQEVRRMDRSNELWRRAEKIRNNEKKRKEASKRKQEKEQREREARRRMGTESQKPYLSPCQGLMSDFVGVGREKKRCVGAEDEGQGWDEGLDDDILLNLDVPDCVSNVDGQKVESLERGQVSDGADWNTTTPTEGMSDLWDIVLPTGTQIQREINDELDLKSAARLSAQTDLLFDLISTQDVSFSEDDEKELGICSAKSAANITAQTSQIRLEEKEVHDRILMPPPKLPSRPQISTKPRVRLKPGPPKKQITSTVEFFPTDFDLSTQDCREIVG